MRRLLYLIEDRLLAWLQDHVDSRLIREHQFEPREDGWAGACNVLLFDDGVFEVRCNRPKERHSK